MNSSNSSRNYLCIFMLQPLLYVRVRHGLSSQLGGKTQEASDRADDVGQSDGPLRQRRLRQGDAASVPTSVHVHQVPGRRLARQTAQRAATSRSTPRRRRKKCTPA